MNQEVRASLLIISRLLGYPPENITEEKNVIKQIMDEHIELTKLKQDLSDAFTPLFRLSGQEFRELYVETFDMKSKLGLYLTAHELGDSNKRGAALIRLQKIVNVAGFERVEGELADYIPMLFEFLAVAPESNDYIRLYRRLSVAVQRIVNHINDQNPYAPILQFLMKYVFPIPTKEEIKELEYNREEADLEELPYPIMYQ